MKTIIINEKEIEIPTNWLDVSFEQFIQFSNISKSRKSEADVINDYKNDSNESDTDAIISLVVSIDNVD